MAPRHVTSARQARAGHPMPARRSAYRPAAVRPGRGGRSRRPPAPAPGAVRATVAEAADEADELGQAEAERERDDEIDRELDHVRPHPLNVSTATRRAENRPRSRSSGQFRLQRPGVPPRMTTTKGAGMATVRESIDVDQPLQTVYNQWTQFEEFPSFMEGVEQVTQTDDTHLHWVAEIGGRRHEWDAEITEQVPDQRVAWISVDGTGTGGIVS